jgi:hypothetical protein
MVGFSSKKMGKEVGQAAVYAKPHTMNGKAFKISDTIGAGYPDKPQDLNPQTSAKAQGHPNGIKIRGTGAATKGVMARGPMA